MCGPVRSGVPCAPVSRPPRLIDVEAQSVRNAKAHGIPDAPPSRPAAPRRARKPAPVNPPSDNRYCQTMLCRTGCMAAMAATKSFAIGTSTMIMSGDGSLTSKTISRTFSPEPKL